MHRNLSLRLFSLGPNISVSNTSCSFFRFSQLILVTWIVCFAAVSPANQRPHKSLVFFKYFETKANTVKRWRILK